MAPQIQFCKSADGTRIGYASWGPGDGLPLVVIPGVGMSMAHPYWAAFFAELSRGRQVVAPDRRGSGSSDRDVERLGVDAEVEDLVALVDHAKLDGFGILATQEACGIAATYAVQHPERVSRLVLFGGFASGPRIARPGAVEAFSGLVRTNFRMARRAIGDMVFPSGPAEDKEALVDGMKDAISPEIAARAFEIFWHMDVTEQLPQVQAPTLVLHRRGDSLVPVSAARELASLIPDARLGILDGDASTWAYDIGQYMPMLREFFGDGVLADTAESATQASGLRTVLFTDLVGHTEMMSRLGDERGRDVLREHERITREVLKANGGTVVKTMGDGFMASFGSVTKAVECAVALQRAFAEREGEPLSVRVGLNAGEPIEEDGDLFGATVILASRIAARAGAGEILVADTVRGLCSGKGFLFGDRGEFVAKGFEEPVRVYEVSWR